MTAFAKPDDFKAKLGDTGPVLALTKLLQPFHVLYADYTYH